jgi:hypothetical protein
MIIKNCKKCGKVFTATSNSQKFCSQLCRNRTYYDNRGGAEYQREYLYKKSLKNGKHKIQCHICGKWYRQVGTHIVQTHKITARQYREEYGFDVKRGQLPNDLRERKARHVFMNKTVNNLKSGKKFWFKRGQEGIGVYKRSQQTLERLKNLSRYKLIKEG